MVQINLIPSHGYDYAPIWAYTHCGTFDSVSAIVRLLFS